MSSRFIKKFSHDRIASEYDEHVKNINSPIWIGYKALLEWVREKTQSSKIIVDLGCGTGNTINALSDNFDKEFCVDISENMLNIAKEKLSDKSNIVFIKKDLLDFFDESNLDNFDTVISTYTIHHLTQKEKHNLFEKIYNILPKGGKIVFGDLMFENRSNRKKMKEKYPNLAKDFDDEFYWHMNDEIKKLGELGFTLEIKRFSDLTIGIYGEK